MKRMLSLGLALLPVWGCAQAGPDAAWAQQAVPDTVEARRVDFPRPPRELATSSPSPDGRQLAGTDGETGDLFVTSIDGVVRTLTPLARSEPYGPPGFAQGGRFSRDGRQIAYLWFSYEGTGGGYQLRVIAASGGEPSVVYSETDVYTPPMDWSPDGRWIAALAGMPDRTWRILLVPAEGGEPRLVRALDWRASNAVSFSPDGRYLAYDLPMSDESHERDIFVYDLESGGERKIVEHAANDVLLGWSPDGTVLFESDRSGAPAAWRMEMRGGRPDREPVLVKPDFWRARAVGFTASGDLYYAVQTGGPVIYSVALNPLTGLVDGVPRALTAPGESTSEFAGITYAAVSQDARLLSFTANVREGAGLTLRGLEGGEGRDIRLPPRITAASRQRWLPDGSGVLFAGQENNRNGLFRFDARSGDIERILDPDEVSAHSLFAFDVTQDGRGLVYRRSDAIRHDGSGWLVLHDLASSEERTLTSLDDVMDEPGRLLSLSPDGRFVAYFRGRAARVSGGDEVDLIVTPLAGGEDRVLAEAGGEREAVQGLAWAADGRALLVAKSGIGIVRAPLDGGTPFEIGVHGVPIRVDPTGTRLIFQKLVGPADPEYAFELWLLRLGGRP